MEQYFINRELSWLEFNYRVLQEAMDRRNPLMERVWFLGIFSNNRDEFFKVRVSTYKRYLRSKNKQEKKIALEYEKEFDAEETLKQIDEVAEKHDIAFYQCFRDLVDEMTKHNILFVKDTQLSEEQGAFVRFFFREKVRPFIFPLMLSNVKDLTGKLHDDESYLVIALSSSIDPKLSDNAIITVPANRLGRFVNVPSANSEKQYIMFLEDVMRYCLSDIFSVYGYDTFQAYTIKFIRDAEFDIDNDMLQSYAQILQQRVNQRKKANTVRFIYDQDIPEKILNSVKKKLKIREKDTVYGSGRYHNFKDFTDFPRINRPELYFTPMSPLPHPAFLPNQSIFKVVKEQDILLHYPYQSFTPIIDLLREAAMDPHVASVNITLYRAAKNSSVVNALINAARNGKKVRVYFELLARFDEEANLHWAAQLQDEGVNVIPAVQAYKVHSKILCITRKEDNKICYYANISTGNFNENTACGYADESFLTSNPVIGKEIISVFDMLEYRFKIPILKKIVISPFYTRKFIIRKIHAEIYSAKQGKKSWMILKMNSLSDKILIEELYKASQAGVKITLIVRGICMLRASVSGLSENIKVVSIVGRFLEHSRIFIFSNNGNPQYYIGSADLMVRNLDNRVETLVPVEDPKLQAALRRLIQLQISDNVKARYMLPDGLYQYAAQNTQHPINAQEDFYKELLKENE
jgi:polyphosphate kinase